MTFQRVLDLLSKNDPVKARKCLVTITDTKERNRYIAIWVCKYGFNELKPTVCYPPQSLIEYRNSPNKDKIDFAALENTPDVRAFFDGKRKNKDNLQWLKDCLGYLFADDIVYRTMLEERILLFEKELGVAHSPETNKVAQMFGGKVVDGWEE